MARELALVITAETQQATQALQQTESALKGVEQAAEKTDKSLSKAEQGIQDLRDRLTQARAKADEMSDALKRKSDNASAAAQSTSGLVSVIGRYVAAGSVPLAIKHSLDFADNLKELSQQSGFSVKSIQTLGFVAQNAGSSFQAVANAANTLDRNLSVATPKVERAIKDMGLSIEGLLSMQPEDRFREIGIAIGRTEDPAQRAELAFALFGRAGAQLLPMFEDLAEGAETYAPRMSSAWVENMAKVQSATETAWGWMKNFGMWVATFPIHASMQAWASAIDLYNTATKNMGTLPGLPGRPDSPLLAPPSTAFDPLNGQSMSYWERTLTQGAQEQIRAGTRRTGSNVIDVPQYVFSGGMPVPLRGSLGFPGFEIPGLRQNLNFAPYAGMLPAQQNLNFAPYAGTVPMNAPNVQQSWFSRFMGGRGGQVAGAGLGMLSGLLPGMSGTGSTIGGLAGSFLGPIGGALGGLVGGGLGKLFGGGEGKKTNRTRDAWISENFGSVDALREAADKAGFSVERMLSVKKVKDFESEVRKLQGAMGESEADAARVGEAMERWGLSIDDMGPKFKQTKINDAFKEALDDLRVLTNAGADFNVIAEKMAPQLGAMVHEAIEMGGTVPREMEPILKKMVELGLLTDKNGEKFTDLSQIPFAADLNKDFATLISKMDALISRISELPGLFDDATRSAEELANVAPDGGDMPTRPDAGSESAPGFDAGGTAGRDWRRRSMRDTIPAWLRPGEVVLTPEQARGGVSVQINGLTVGGGMSRGETAEQVGKAVVAYMERRGVRFGRRVA